MTTTRRILAAVIAVPLILGGLVLLAIIAAGLAIASALSEN